MTEADAFLFAGDSTSSKKKGRKKNKTPPRGAEAEVEERTQSKPGAVARSLSAFAQQTDVLIPGRHRCSCHGTRHKLYAHTPV